MLAILEKFDNGYIARFERHFKFSNDEVWSWLTQNDKLNKWFPELSIDELRVGGIIRFDFGDGNFEKMEIIDFTEKSILEFTWGDDYVRFELSPESNGCKLVLTEKIKTITPHTPKDLAGWHVCLDVIHTLVNGKTVNSETKDWRKWYRKYAQSIEKVTEKTN